MLEKILEEIEAHAIEFETFGVSDDYISVGWVKDIIRKHINNENLVGGVDRSRSIDESRTRGWIPVEERLPEEKGVYLVTYHPCYWDDVESEIKVGIDTFMGKTAWSKRKFQRVIAWMPLPEPYSPEPLERSERE